MREEKSGQKEIRPLIKCFYSRLLRNNTTSNNAVLAYSF